MTVTILGNNSALPAYNRHPTAQLVSIEQTDILVDCGEGTQIQMQRYGLRWSRIVHLCISHLHGDHYFGLPGLLNSMALLGRTAPLFLWGPAGLDTILYTVMRATGNDLGYELIFSPLPEGAGVLIDNEHYQISCFPVVHSIACHGFVITQKQLARKLLVAECEQRGIPVEAYKAIKKGKDYSMPDGTLVPNALLTEDGKPEKRYAYSADTIYLEEMLPHIRGANVLYHESTYLEAEIDKAVSRFHSTARQAATIASMAGVGKLRLGHYSSRYKHPEDFETEAKEVFEHSMITREGETYEV
jgi:ribonuclease Z